MAARIRVEGVGATDGAEALGEAFQKMLQGFTHIQEALVQQDQLNQERLREQEQRMEVRFRELERMIREASGEQERRIWEFEETTEATIASVEEARRVATSAFEDKFRRMEESVEVLERCSRPSGGREGGQATGVEVRFAPLESRMEHIQVSTQRALQSAVPRVNALLNKLEKPSPPAALPRPTSSTYSSTPSVSSSPTTTSSTSVQSSSVRFHPLLSPTTCSAAPPSQMPEQRSPVNRNCALPNQLKKSFPAPLPRPTSSTYSSTPSVSSSPTTTSSTSVLSSSVRVHPLPSSTMPEQRSPVNRNCTLPNQLKKSSPAASPRPTSRSGSSSSSAFFVTAPRSSSSAPSSSSSSPLPSRLGSLSTRSAAPPAMTPERRSLLQKRCALLNRLEMSTLAAASLQSTSTSGAGPAPLPSSSSLPPRLGSVCVRNAAPPSLTPERRRALGEALLQAADAGREDEVEKLLDSGADVNFLNSSGCTPLMCAASSHVNVVSLLIRRGADINAKSKQRSTALHFACKDDSGRCASLLIRAGALVESANLLGQRPLHWAADWGNAAAARALLAAGASTSVRANTAETPLDCASTDAVRRLLRT